MRFFKHYLMVCFLSAVVTTYTYADTTYANYNLHANQPVDTDLTGSVTLSCDQGGNPATASIDHNSITDITGPLFYIPQAAGTALMGAASTGQCTLTATFNTLPTPTTVTQGFTVTPQAAPNTTQIKSITVTKVSGEPCLANKACQASSYSLLSVGVSQNAVQDSSGKWYAQPCICPIVFQN